MGVDQTRVHDGDVTIGGLTLSLFHQDSGAPEESPMVLLDVSDLNLKVLGGGVKLSYDPQQVGQLLTSAFPVSATGWMAEAKDCHEPSSGSLTAYCVAAPVPDDAYQLFTVLSTPATRPTAVALLPRGFELVGGGAQAVYGKGAGSYLYASHPLVHPECPTVVSIRMYKWMACV